MHRLSALPVAFALTLIACETTAPSSYYLVDPSRIQPETSTGLTRWDSAADLREWTENPWNEGTYALHSADGLDFVHVDLRPGVSFRLYSPNLAPVFTGLRSVRVRIRWTADPATPTAALNRVFAHVKATVPPTPASVNLLAGYIVTPAPVPGVWQALDLVRDSDTYYPSIIEAKWLDLSLGRDGNVNADIDWIELVR